MEAISFVQQNNSPIPIRAVEEHLADGCGEETDNSTKWKKHGPLLPDSIRALFVGSSGCGKTNAMVTLLYDPNGLAFNNIYIYSKSLFQPKYRQLEAILRDIPEIGYFSYSDSNNIVKPADAKEHSVFIFDDVACDSQSTMREYYSMARHKHIDTFYLIQSYTKAPKQLIRDNVNFLILFPQDRHNLKYAYDEHVNVDMDFNNFLNLCNKCWSSRPFGFLLIDKTSPVDNGRYRLCFDEYVIMNGNYDKPTTSQLVDREIKEKLELIDVKNAIREKLRNLRRGDQNYQMAMEKKFKPLIQSSSTTPPPPQKPKEKKKETNDDNPLMELEDSELEDKRYGIRKLRGKGRSKYYLGRYPIRIGVKKIQLANNEFKTSPGLMDLLTRKEPQSYTDNDARDYKAMLELTAHHLTRYGDMKDYGDYKSEFIVKPLFAKIKPEEDVTMETDDGSSSSGDDEENTIVEETDTPQRSNLPQSTPITERYPKRKRTLRKHYDAHSGKGLRVGPFVQAHRPSPTYRRNYVYWNDVNELVERLCLLHASVKAGNTGLLPEIYNIEEELREANIIE